MKLIARDSVFCDAQRQRKKKRKKSCKNSYSIYLRRRKTENVGRNCTLIEIDLFDSTVDISHTLARASTLTERTRTRTRLERTDEGGGKYEGDNRIFGASSHALNGHRRSSII